MGALSGRQRKPASKPPTFTGGFDVADLTRDAAL